MFFKEKRHSLSWKAKHLLLALGIGSCSMLQGTMAFAAGDGDGSASENIINIVNESIHDDIVAGYIDNGKASENKIIISGKNTSISNEYTYGGKSKNGTVSNNIIDIRGGTIDSRIHAGDVQNGNVSGNIVNISDGNFTGGWISGGHIGGSGTATNNTVNISGGTFNVKFIEGSWGSGNHLNNTVNISGGIINGGIISGAWVEDSTTASGNTVNISGGAISNNTIAGAYIIEERTGNANGNTVNISGNPVISNSNIYGGWAPNGDAKDNTINIYGNPDLSTSTLYAGKAGSNNTSTGNSLNIYTKDLTAKNISGFQDLNYYLPSNISNGDKILTLTDTTGTDLSNTRVNVAARGNTKFSVGDTFTLLQNDNGITVSNITNSGILAEGISRDYALSLSNVESKGSGTTGIKAIVGERLTDGLKPQTEAIAQSALPVISLMHIGSDRILHWLPPEEGLPGEDEKEDIESEMIEPTNEFKMFANMDFSSIRTKTGNGSYVDSKTGGMDLGWARSIENSSGTSRLIFAPVIDYGKGNYDSYLGNGIHGHGKMNYLAGGMIARKMFANGFYYEGSFRIGRAKADFTSDDFMRGDVPTTVSYDTSTPIWAGHINLGKFYKLSNRDTVQVYAHYFHSHQNGMHTTLSTGERYEFDSIDSGRFRAGIHLTRQVNKKSRFYSGLAYQYEFSGDSRGTYDGSKTPSSKIKGSSGMIELGYQLKPSESVPWMIDAGLVGWIGHQKGLSFQVKAKKSF